MKEDLAMQYTKVDANKAAHRFRKDIPILQMILRMMEDIIYDEAEQQGMFNTIFRIHNIPDSSLDKLKKAIRDAGYRVETNKRLIEEFYPHSTIHHLSYEDANAVEMVSSILVKW